MKVLLDECIDRRLGAELVGHEVSTVVRLGWSGVKNGELLRRATAQFDAFVTVDRNLSVSRISAGIPSPFSSCAPQAIGSPTCVRSCRD